MTEKWTPGPWRVSSRLSKTLVECHGERSVCSTGGYQNNAEDSDKVLAENIANAHLIASAPALYEALEAAINIFDDMVRVGVIGPKDGYFSYYLGDDLEALQPLRTALRAARGEQ